jgi:hypothetical protein
MNKALGTRLAQIFGGRLKGWADELQKRSDTVVAISRKGPRLIELMAREGFLSKSVLSRVIAEQALPFLTQNDNAGFVVVDDAMTYGTTFDRIYRLTEQANIRCGGDSLKPTGIPFAVCKKANEEHRKLAAKYFLNLEPDQIASFVNNEMLAFRLLGKPYDIEHPMLTWTGDFTDEYKLEAALQDVTELLGGQKTNIDTLVPTVAGNVPVRCWTILLPTDSRSNLYPRADFGKLRIYLNPEKNRLLVAAMRPLSLSKADMDSLGEILPAPLNHLWCEAAGMIVTKDDTEAERHMAIAGSRSLAMWANFLFAVVFLRDVKATFLEAFENTTPQPQMLGPHREDLQYLIGPDLCRRAESSFSQFLECVDVNLTPASYPLFDHTAEIMEERIPPEYEEDYKKKLPSLIDKALEVNDVLQTIFYTQHTDIELISRIGNDNIDDDERLEFGVTYSKLCQTVMNRFPDAIEIDIHECFDKLIDDGAIVPRYLDMASPGKSAIWARTFRVGEGAVQKAAQTVRLLFEKLSKELKKPELPAVLFEKFCALALCVANDNGALRPLQSVGISKVFHLYGARPALMLQGQRREFLTEWAINQNILSRSKRANFTEESGSYSLGQDIETLYPSRECPWDDDVKDGLEDLAALVAAIYKKYNGATLVALTSAASNQELQRALEAELQLWLYDHTAAVSKGLAELSRLAEDMTVNIPTEDQLENANRILSNTANFTAQVNVKIKLAENRKNIYRQIDELVDTDKYLKRCWRKLRTTLDGRISSEYSSSDLQKIISTLRIAHATTRILRELLTLAGFKDERSKGLEESLNLLQNLLNNTKNIDSAIKTMFTITDSKPAIATLLTAVKGQPLDSFIEAFPSVRELVLEIADLCESALHRYGIDRQTEQPQILPPPHYIMMWDIIGSSSEKIRDKIESLIVDANQRIKETFGDRIMGFRADSKDDGNNFTCKSFTDVLTAFEILNDVFRGYYFRAGCEANLQGELKYYPESKSLGGKAFEYAARVMAFYKEIKANPTLWSNNTVPVEPTETSFMVVSEFAKRYAQEEKTWPTDEIYIVNELDGKYKARINAPFPVSLTVLHLAASKRNGLGDTELHEKQPELL